MLCGSHWGSIGAIWGLYRAYRRNGKGNRNYKIIKGYIYIYIWGYIRIIGEESGNSTPLPLKSEIMHYTVIFCEMCKNASLTPEPPKISKSCYQDSDLSSNSHGTPHL